MGLRYFRILQSSMIMLIIKIVGVQECPLTCVEHLGAPDDTFLLVRFPERANRQELAEPSPMLERDEMFRLPWKAVFSGKLWEIKRSLTSGQFISLATDRKR